MSAFDPHKAARRRFLTQLLVGGGLSLLMLPSTLRAASRVAGVRASADSASTRLVIDLDGPLDYRIFTLTGPDRVVLDLPGVSLAAPLDVDLPGHSVASSVRSGIRDRTDLRLVVDVKGPIKPQALLLPPSEGAGFRLVVDLPHAGGVAASAVKPAEPVEPSTARAADPLPRPQKSRPSAFRDLVIAIDAGHGGKDPGAVGRSGTREKDVTLAIARKLERILHNEAGFKPVLTRSTDKFISLRERTQIARRHKADMFISIHADAFYDSSARGSSVYCVSHKGSSSEAARWLANKENAADLVGGVSLGDHDDVVASVLLDLAQTAALQSSLDVGGRVLRQLGDIGDLHRREVQQAGFMVLKSPDIPSILVESAFISNPGEEQRLRTSSHQDRVAQSIFRGVHGYYANKAIDGTRFASL